MTELQNWPEVTIVALASAQHAFEEVMLHEMIEVGNLPGIVMVPFALNQDASELL